MPSLITPLTLIFFYFRTHLDFDNGDDIFLDWFVLDGLDFAVFLHVMPSHVYYLFV